MASFSQPLTPDPVEYASLKTPGGGDAKSQGSRGRTTDSASWSTKYWYLGSLAQILTLGCIGLYVVAAVVYLTPYYWVLDPKIGVWWGVPSKEELEANPDTSGGHGEMNLPTYLFLGLFAPFALSMVTIAFLRKFNMRRITSRYILKIAMVLRRKPYLFGKLSYFGYGELLFLVGFLLGGNVLVSWYQFDAYIGYIAPEDRDFDAYMHQLGLLLGYTCVWNMAFLFLPATRNCVWMEFFGISYANGIKYHRWAGVMVVLTGVAHTCPYYYIWLRDGIWTHESLPCFNCGVGNREEGKSIWFNFYGELALLMFLAIAFTSLPWIRRRMYETFYYVHHLFPLGVLFTVLHWQTTTWFVFPSLLVYLIDRAVSSSNAFWPVHVTEFTALSDGIIKIVIARSPHDDGSYHIGQFVYLNVPAISKLQWHPFTIASSPRTSATTLTILLKSLGDWTAALTEYAEDCKSKSVAPTVYMDGYYGESLDKYEAYPTVCLVAGGVGVTPILAILEDMVAKLSHGEPPNQRVFLTFTFRELSLLEELHPVLARLREVDPNESFFSAQFYLTRVPSEVTLDQRIDHERIAFGGGGGKRGDLGSRSTANASSSSKIPTVFAERLRTAGFKPAMYFVIFFLSVFFVAWLEYGNGRIVKGGEASEYWMLQYAVEICVLFVVTPLAYVFVWLEHKLKIRKATANHEAHMLSPAAMPHVRINGDLHTLRDLVAEYDVTLGNRPHMEDVIEHVVRGHEAFMAAQHPSTTTDGVVGVFVSGPEPLKIATEYAIAHIGAHHFDLHAEEFEL
uniref:FAD-binding FR-type domain-containing protein n=1 Tax=Globisporangium ultimum (strain ATCC 200006 / CBS 805.95 / DAOM BR144) TaxID=431595 RepID=K3WU64_GLOUD